MLFAKSDEVKELMVMGWSLLNFAGSPFYISGALVYELGRQIDSGDSKKYDDSREKRRQAEEKRRQEEHEMQMALLRKKLEEK